MRINVALIAMSTPPHIMCLLKLQNGVAVVIYHSDVFMFTSRLRDALRQAPFTAIRARSMLARFVPVDGIFFERR